MRRFKLNEKLQNLKFCYEFRAVIRYIKAAFYRKTLNVSVHRKTWPRICLKTYGRAFEMFSRAFKTLGRAFKKPS